MFYVHPVLLQTVLFASRFCNLSSKSLSATHEHITEDIQDLRDNMARLFQEQMKKIAEIVKAPQDVKFDQLTTSVATLTNNFTSLFEIVGSVERQLSVISNALDIDHITHIPPGQESTSPVPSK